MLCISDIDMNGRRIRRLDIFKKVPSEVSRGTDLGGLVSLFTAALILFLFCREIANFFSPEYAAEISSDKLFTREEMTINLDISFPAFPCEIISLDLEDSMASHHPNIGSVQKWRLDREGRYVDSRHFELLHEHSPGRQLQLVREAFKKGYGCRLMGSFTVKEVPGNFHVSCHAYYNHFMEMVREGVVRELNMTHQVNQLYFGKEHHLQRLKGIHPEAQLHLLENRTVVEEQHRSFNYHIDIVPTWYHEGVVSNYYTYQYTYHRNAYKAVGQPGVLHFNYHIGGLAVGVAPRDQDFWIFMTHLCAILGGTYAICRAIYNWLSRFQAKWEYQLLE